MTARSETIQIDIDDEQMSGTFLSPKSKVPGVLFVHGWGAVSYTHLTLPTIYSV